MEKIEKREGEKERHSKQATKVANLRGPSEIKEGDQHLDVG